MSSALKEVKMENKIAGADHPKKRSPGHWVSHYMAEFALLARKLRKNNKDASGNPDKYTVRIERELSKVDAALDMLESDPSWAVELGESGAEIDDILDFLERKAAEKFAEKRTETATNTIMKTLPQYRLTAISKQSGGFADRAAAAAEQAGQ